MQNFLTAACAKYDLGINAELLAGLCSAKAVMLSSSSCMHLRMTHTMAYAAGPSESSSSCFDQRLIVARIMMSGKIL